MLDWREIELDGATVEGLANTSAFGRGVLVWGARAGRPYAAHVSAAREVTERLPGWDGRVTGVLQHEPGDLRVTGGSPPRTDPGDADNAWSPVHEDNPYVAGWVVSGDEDPCHLALSTSGQLHAYEHGGETPVPGPHVVTGRTAEDLVVAGAEIGLLVAGPLAPATPRHGTRGVVPTAWSYAGEVWTELDVAAPPVAYTDAYTRSEPLLAGHRHGRPLVHSHAGTPLASPQVDLDPTHPHVCLAHVDGTRYGSREPGWQERLVLVVQTVEGVQVWVQHARGWTMLPGPKGRLQAARLGYHETWAGWVVTEGRLWFADLTAVWDALG